MDPIISSRFATLEEADAVATRLRERGVPEHAITIEDLTPAHGISLGAGVPMEATNAVVEDHDGEISTAGYVVSVDPTGDPLNEAAAREVFGSGA